MAAVHNLYVDQGADFTVEVGIFDDNNAAWDLSGYSVAARYLYDVVVTSSGGTKTRVIEGIVTINAGIT